MDRDKMLDVTLQQIEKQFGKGAVMKLGEHPAGAGVSVIPTGSLALDLALGIGGVPRGRIMEVFGPEGSGKTTVVKILATLLKADAGTVSVNGFDVATQAAEVRESISLTGQFAAVDDILNGRENLVLVARLRHLKNPGRIADDLLEQFSLTEAATRKVSTYSGGMRRRLDIANTFCIVLEFYANRLAVVGKCHEFGVEAGEQFVAVDQP